MEIEAKFTVPDRQVYTQLARLRKLAGYGLVKAGVVVATDQYFDTADRRVLAGGYACRLRRQGEMLIATLKGVGGAEGAVHRRDEREAQLPAWSAAPAAWPESDARSLALELTGGAALHLLFTLTQRRRRASVMQGKRRVAELTLDAVRVLIGRKPTSYFELEVELAPDGTEADLAAIARELADAWGLTPAPRSKFERALEILGKQQPAAAPKLTTQERAALEGLSANSDPALARHSRVVLAWADGLRTPEIAAATGLSAGRIRYWVRAFQAKRLAVFAPAEAKVAPVPAPAPAQRRKGLPTIAEFAAGHGVDPAHARAVSDHAMMLFAVLKSAHRLPKKQQKLLRQAALLATVGATADPARPYPAGRDLILAQPLRDVTTADRLALACIVAFQREKAKPEREPTFSALEEKQQGQVLALAALLRMAEALDFSHTQATALHTVESPDADQVEISVDGPGAEADARQATLAAVWWRQLIHQELAFTVGAHEAPAATAPAVAPALETLVGEPLLPPLAPLQPDDPMCEAGRKAIYAHYLKMLANEAGTRLGEDIEALHDMRVATRRMRAAYRIFEDYFDPAAVAPFNRGLRRTGGALGQVRDLDVLLEKAAVWQAGLDEGQTTALEPLLADWRGRRAVARKELLDYLDSPTYRQFVAEFGAFLTTSGAGARKIEPGAPTPYLVCHVVPRLVLTRYEAVRAYETVLAAAPQTTYHALRIDFKRLRYALEFFREVLGPETADLIKASTAMQDLLGNLQDANVAEGLVREFLASQTARRKPRYTPDELAPIETYLAYQQATQADLLAQFPGPWAIIVGAEFRRSLALAVAAL